MTTQGDHSDRLDQDLRGIETSIANLALQSQQQVDTLAEIKGMSNSLQVKVGDYSGIPATITNKLDELKLSFQETLLQPSPATIEKLAQIVQATEANVSSAITSKIAKPMDDHGVALKKVSDVTTKTSESLEMSKAVQQSNFDTLLQTINALSEDDRKSFKETFDDVDRKLNDILDANTELKREFETLGITLEDLKQEFPADVQTYWSDVDFQLASIVEKIDAVKADVSSLARRTNTTSSPSTRLTRHDKRPPEPNLDAPETSRRRRSSQQSPAGGHLSPSSGQPESPLVSRSATRPQTQSQI